MDFPARLWSAADGFDAAWLLVQHADADPAFQQRVLELLISSNDRSQANSSHC